jgi:cation transport regulator ChaB
MPYKVGGDNQPANVKAMPASKQKQWISVFNSAFKKYGDEGKAFKLANGVAKKTKSFTEDVWSRLRD